MDGAGTIVCVPRGSCGLVSPAMGYTDQHDWNFKIGDKILLRKDGTLRKSESWYESDPWTIATVHTNGTIRVQHRKKIRMIKH